MRRAPYLLYLASTIAGRLAMLVVLVVLTRLLTPENYGLFALVVATGEILDMSMSNWVRILYLREESGRDRLRAVRLGRMFTLMTASTLAAFLVAIGVAFAADGGNPGVFALSTIAYVASFALLRVALTLSQQRKDHAGFTAIELSRSLVAVPAVAGAAAWAGGYAAPALALALTTALVAGLGLARNMRGQPAPRRPRHGYSAALRFGLPVAAVSFLSFAFGWFDRFILNAWEGPAAVGIYAAAFALGRQPVALFLGALNTYTFPKLAELANKGGLDSVARAQTALLSSMSAVGAAAAAGLWALADPLARVLFAPQFATEAAPIVPWIAGGALLVSLKSFVFDNSFHMTKATGRLIGYMLPAAVAGLAASMILIDAHGLAGAAWAFLAGTGIALLASAATSFTVLRFALPWRRLAEIAAAAVLGGLAARLASDALHGWGPLAQAAGGGLVLAAVYLGTLRICGFSLAAFLAAPWEIQGRGAAA
ncbi:MAG: lipopolysaccharide biosynthesis protein [Flavobacteriaceae bacterium]